MTIGPGDPFKLTVKLDRADDRTIARGIAPSVQIADALRKDIANGALKPGDQIPTVRETADQWRVAMSTAAKAHVILRTEGLIVGRPGKGTFVRDVQ